MQQTFIEWAVPSVAFKALIGLAVGTLCLLLLALGMHWASTARASLERSVRKRWAPLLLESMHAPLKKPRKLRRREVPPVMALFNHYHEAVRGTAKDGLNAMARAVRLDQAALKMLNGGGVKNRLFAITALGNLRERSAWNRLARLSASRHTYLSLAAARAMIQIDAAAAMPILSPLVAKRRDWPPPRIAAFLKESDPDTVSRFLAAAACASPDQAQRLIRYLQAVNCAPALPAVRQILQHATDPETIGACLDFLGHFSRLQDLDKVRRQLDHSDWIVRVHALTVLGKMGTQEDEFRLVRHLSDPHWWVRYRAARALAGLPFVGPERLEQIRARHPDRFARDILAQVSAECA